LDAEGINALGTGDATRFTKKAVSPKKKRQFHMSRIRFFRKQAMKAEPFAEPTQR